MREITITSNDSGRRLDRFLRKYLRNASLSEIYKLIRKDIKVSGRRRPESYMLEEGDILTIYVSDEVLAKLSGASAGAGKDSAARGTVPGRRKAKRQFRIIYEDDNILIADKPFGLLTHGDAREKKNHLANQVKDYLIEKGEYDPGSEKIFAPAPVNRLDRNTTGLVLFGKNAASLKALNAMIRDNMVSKYYRTIVHGIISDPCKLSGTLTKDKDQNKVRIKALSVSDREDSEKSALSRAAVIYNDPGNRTGGRDTGGFVITEVVPVGFLDIDNRIRATDTEIRLVTGRSHQIRAHLAGIGHPLLGDTKYATRAVVRDNEYLRRKFGLSTQLLHAYRLVIDRAPEELSYLEGREFTAPLPESFSRISGCRK